MVVGISDTIPFGGPRTRDMEDSALDLATGATLRVA